MKPNDDILPCQMCGADKGLCGSTWIINEYGEVDDFEPSDMCLYAAKLYRDSHELFDTKRTLTKYIQQNQRYQVLFSTVSGIARSLRFLRENDVEICGYDRQQNQIIETLWDDLDRLPQIMQQLREQEETNNE